MNFDPEFFNKLDAFANKVQNVPWFRILFLAISAVGAFSFGWWMMGLLMAWART